MAILEGPQGKLKSTALRILAVRDEWFADRLSHVDTKDASIETAGIWIFEISEMEGLLKAAPSAQKRFISSRSDRYLPPYGKHTISRPRLGTINPPADGCYLQDPTGARRYWPLTCIGMIDVAGLEQIRDQLWAEAVYLFKAGRPWHLETPELEALATVEQDKRFVVDPWEKPIREWLGDRTDITIWDVLEHALGLNRKQQQAQPTQKRVVSILTRLRFTQRHPRTPGGGREWRYQRDPPLKKDD
jgi:predicted P-loop ATPase